MTKRPLIVGAPIARAEPTSPVRATFAKVGISACFFHPDPDRAIFRGKTLEYIEQSVARWLMACGALPVMIPSPDGERRGGETQGGVTVDHYADWLDALVLEGGSDVWPGSYGETPLRPEWSGDRVRDDYEKALAQAFVRVGKPVLGICRGQQLLNVLYGGTLYQDLAVQRPGPVVHRDPVLYDRHVHEVRLAPGSRLSALYGGRLSGTVNSIHHQAIRDLAPGFVVEAWSADDLIEAVRMNGDSFVAAVQWHPEFAREGDGTLDSDVILRDFLAATQVRV